jgi:HSP20 family protein
VSESESVREELSHAWSALLSGWRELYQRAAGASTRFHSRPKKGELQTADEQEVALRRSDWGLLAAELFDSDEKIIVRLEAPGMERDHFDLQVVDDCFVIRGRKVVEREHSEGRYHFCECAYDSFERAIPWPEAVEVGQ